MVTTRWISSASWDLLWISNTFWLTLALLIAGTFIPWNRLSELILFAIFPLISFTHLLAPIVTVWSSKNLRRLLWQNELGTLWLTVLIVAVSVFLCFQGGYSNSQTLIFQLLFLIYTPLNLWHICKQNFGLLSLYRFRSEQVSTSHRTFDLVYCVLLGSLMMPEVLLPHWNHFRESLLSLPIWTPPVPSIQVVLIPTLILVIVAIIRECSLTEISFPKLLLLLSLGLQPVITSISKPVFFYGACMLGHFLTELSLNCRIVASELTFLKAFRSKKFEIGVYLFLLSMIAIFLNWINFRTGVTEILGEGKLHFVRAWPFPTPFDTILLNLTSGLCLSVFFLHFIYDRTLYCLRNGEVRKVLTHSLFEAKQNP